MNAQPQIWYKQVYVIVLYGVWVIGLNASSTSRCMPDRLAATPIETVNGYNKIKKAIKRNNPFVV